MVGSPAPGPPSPGPPVSMEIPDMTPIETFDAIVWSFFAIAFVTTVLRLYTRIFIVKGFGLDDGLVLIGQLAAVGYSAMSHMQASALYSNYLLSVEAGRPLLFETPASIRYWDLSFRYAFISDSIYLITLPVVKCSILAFYWRITTTQKQRYVLYFVAFLLLGQGVANLIATTLAFEDPSSIWTPITTPTTMRYDGTDLQIVNSGFQVLFDVIILLLPVPIIFKTKFRSKARAGLVIIYILSFFNLAVTIVRLDAVIQFAKLTNLFEAATKRIEYAYWGVVEVMTAIMCANLPAMSAFLRFVSHDKRCNPSTTASHQHHSSSSSSSSSSSFPTVLRLWFNKSMRSIRVATSGASRHSSDSHSEERSTTDFHEKKDVADISEVAYMSSSSSSSPIRGGARTGTDKSNAITTTTTAYNTRISARDGKDNFIDNNNNSNNIDNNNNNNNHVVDPFNSRFDFELPKQQGAVTKPQPSVAPTTRSQDGIYRTDKVEVESSVV